MYEFSFSSSPECYTKRSKRKKTNVTRNYRNLGLYQFWSPFSNMNYMRTSGNNRMISVNGIISFTQLPWNGRLAPAKDSKLFPNFVMTISGTMDQSRLFKLKKSVKGQTSDEKEKGFIALIRKGILRRMHQSFPDSIHNFLRVSSRLIRNFSRLLSTRTAQDFCWISELKRLWWKLHRQNYRFCMVWSSQWTFKNFWLLQCIWKQRQSIRSLWKSKKQVFWKISFRILGNRSWVLAKIFAETRDLERNNLLRKLG